MSMSLTAASKSYLVLPAALLLAFYASIISLGLMADIYTPPEDIDHASSDYIHREQIQTRTVKCLAGCAQWGAFARFSGSKETGRAGFIADELENKSRQQTLTAGLDRVYGRQLIGFALGASKGDATITTIGGGRTNIYRDKTSVGLYYGAALPKYFNLTAQLLFSDYDYETKRIDGGREYAFARYDAKGYSSGLGLSNIIPLKLNEFDFTVEPSISYMYVQTNTDGYLGFRKSELTSTEWQFALKWRKLMSIGSTYLVPMGGFSYNLRELQFKGGSFDRNLNQDYFEGLLGLTLQRNNLNLSAAYQKTIAEDSFDREQYQITLRMNF
jgi:hypothetical protein